jgi:hypothetical protein
MGRPTRLLKRMLTIMRMKMNLKTLWKRKWKSINLRIRIQLKRNDLGSGDGINSRINKGPP